MSDIWHTADEIPDFNKSYVELSRSVQGDLVYSTWGHPNYITKNTIKWCYMDDLLALETELDRTRKALDIAKDAIDKGEATLIGCQEADDKYISDVIAEDGLELMSEAYKKITALEQKDE